MTRASWLTICRCSGIVLMVVGLLIFAIATKARQISLDHPVPKFTDVQRLTLHNRLLTFQLAQAQLEAYLKEVAVPGYTIDLNTLLYVPVQGDNSVKSKAETP